jgi:hypothetical protein
MPPLPGPKPAERIGDGSDEAAGLKLLDVLLDRRADVLVVGAFRELGCVSPAPNRVRREPKARELTLSEDALVEREQGRFFSAAHEGKKAPASAMSGSHRKRPP